MPSLNKVFLIGNLTRDPEVRTVPSGAVVCSFGMAISRQFTNNRGETREEVCFVEVDAWGRTGEVIKQYVHKGNPIFIEGSLKFDQWDDKETQKRRSRLSVRCERMQLLGSPSGGSSQTGGGAGGYAGGAPSYGGGGYAPAQGAGYGQGAGGYAPRPASAPAAGGYRQPPAGGAGAGGYRGAAPGAQAAPTPAAMPRFEPIPEGNSGGGGAAGPVPPMAGEPMDDILF